MGRNRHKRKNNHVVIVTSDAADARMKQFRIRPWILQTIIIILCIVIGALIGYFSYEKDIWAAKLQETTEQNDVISVLEEEKAALEAQIAGLNEEIAGLNEKIQILSNTVSQKVQTESELAEQLEKEFLPTRLPVSERATMEDRPEGDDLRIYGCGNSMVVATASGTVIAVNEDPEYGNNVWIDHGNGYTTIYRNQGEVKVKQNETVTQGTTLFLITGESSKLGYQMMKDGEYVDPMEMLNISG